MNCTLKEIYLYIASQNARLLGDSLMDAQWCVGKPENIYEFSRRCDRNKRGEGYMRRRDSVTNDATIHYLEEPWYMYHGMEVFPVVSRSNYSGNAHSAHYRERNRPRFLPYCFIAVRYSSRFHAPPIIYTITCDFVNEIETRRLKFMNITENYERFTAVYLMHNTKFLDTLLDYVISKCVKRLK